MTQTAKIKSHLIEKGHITGAEAFELYGCYRLSAIIFNLRKRGMNIRTVIRKGDNRYGEEVEFGEYLYDAKNENV